jgi:predicted sulfurtransferase
MGKVLIFYKYVHIEFPKRAMKWQQQICTDLGLTGRIILGHEGINGTVGGTDEACERYKEIMAKHPIFNDIDFKESAGGADCFSKLQIKIKNEIVNLGLDPATVSPKDGGQHLTADQVHELLQNRPDDFVLLDTRNDFEWAIGKFTESVTPEIKNFREFPDYIEKNLEQFKDKQVLMVCTAGIRCERATAVLQQKGVAKKVFQIRGGIHRYVEQFPEGFFRGKNYVFDNRIAIKVNDDVLGSCYLCTKQCDSYTNCLNAECNRHFISCAPCEQAYNSTCSDRCRDLVAQCKVHIREKRQPVVYYPTTGPNKP